MSISVEPTAVVYQFHLLLRSVSPAIWRHILVTSDSTVADLHHIVQISMGWSDINTHRFVLYGHDYGLINATQVPLTAWHLRRKERLLYAYGWLVNGNSNCAWSTFYPLTPTYTIPTAWLEPDKDRPSNAPVQPTS